MTPPAIWIPCSNHTEDSFEDICICPLHGLARASRAPKSKSNRKKKNEEAKPCASASNGQAPCASKADALKRRCASCALTLNGDISKAVIVACENGGGDGDGDVAFRDAVSSTCAWVVENKIGNIDRRRMLSYAVESNKFEVFTMIFDDFLARSRTKRDKARRARFVFDNALRSAGSGHVMQFLQFLRPHVGAIGEDSANITLAVRDGSKENILLVLRFLLAEGVRFSEEQMDAVLSLPPEQDVEHLIKFLHQEAGVALGDPEFCVRALMERFDSESLKYIVDVGLIGTPPRWDILESEFLEAVDDVMFDAEAGGLDDDLVDELQARINNIDSWLAENTRTTTKDEQRLLSVLMEMVYAHKEDVENEQTFIELCDYLKSLHDGVRDSRARVFG